jgi:hypothetical protein
MDINGNIFFTNYYYPENTGQNPLTFSQYNSTSDWYLGLKMANNINDINNTSGILSNICRMDNTGQVSSLGQTSQLALSIPPYYTTPGPMLSDFSNDFLPGPDGSLLYTMKYTPYTFYGLIDLNQYDMTQQDIEHTYLHDGSFLFISYDTSVATGLPSGSVRTPSYDITTAFNNYLVLPNNDILYSPFNNQSGPNSLYAYNMSNKTVYCYAGTENENSSVQNNETGNAKFVQFQSNLRFCGQDRQGSVYYCTGSYDYYNSFPGGLTDYVNGVRFYKLHRKGT